MGFWVVPLLSIAQFDKAKTLLQDARRIAEEHNFHEALVQVEFESGKLYRDHREWDRAYAHFLAAQRILESKTSGGFDILVYAAVPGNLGYVSLKRGDLPEAKDLLLKSLNVFEEHDSKTFRARLQLWLAIAEERMGNHLAAANYTVASLKWLSHHGTSTEVTQLSEMLDRLQVGLSDSERK